MKIPASPFPRAALAAILLQPLLSPAASAQDIPAVYENFDGYVTASSLVGTVAKGYGINGTYVTAGNIDANAFKIADGGLSFGALNSAAGKCIQVDAANATGFGILLDGGKALGDTTPPSSSYEPLDSLYLSYLINFSQITSLANGRAVLRINDTATGTASRFQIAADHGTASVAQPAVASSDDFSSGSGVLTGGVSAPTYLMIGRFSNVGNALGTAVSTTATWSSGATTITVASNTGIVVGQTVAQTAMTTNTILCTIPAGAVVTAISGTTITISSATTGAGSALGVSFFFETITTTATWTSPSAVIVVANNSRIFVGQAVTGAGIPAGRTVTAVAGNNVTLNGATTENGTRAAVSFSFGTSARVQRSELFALTAAQHANFINPDTDNGGGAGTDAYLTNATVGSAATQVTAKAFSVSAIGTSNFRHGNGFTFVAEGSSSSRQIFKLDELRYGLTLKSVSHPDPFATGPADEVVENFNQFDLDTTYSRVHNTGSGWKSGFYELQETPTPGAYGFPYVVFSPGEQMLPGSGDYLSVLANRDTGSTDQGLRRRPNPDFVNLSQPHTVSFSFKPTSGLTQFSAFGDRFQIGGDVDGTGFGSTAEMAWLIGVVGGNDGARTYFPGKWYFFDNNGVTAGSPATNFLQENMQNTNISLLTGHTYSFVIQVNPALQKYSATIIDQISLDGSIVATYTARNLDFRNKTLATNIGAPPTTLLFGTARSSTTDDREFGLDSIRITRGIDDYPDFIAGFPTITVPADQARGADFDLDGLKNFAEFALDGNPASGAANARVVAKTANVSGSNYHTITIPVLADATFAAGSGPRVSNVVDGLTYTVQGSYDLLGFNAANIIEVTPAITAGLPSLSSAVWTYKTFRLSETITAQPKGFLRVLITNLQ